MPTKTDLSTAAKLMIMTPPSWLLPIERLDIAAELLRRWGGRRAREPGGAEAIIARSLSVAPQQAQQIYGVWKKHAVEASMQILALLRPGRVWRPAIRWQGLEHLTAALERGHGAILWTSDFVYRTLLCKVAFHQAGFRLVQLSRPEHGFSVSPFGVRFLNPLWIRVEDRFLGDRIIIRNNDTRVPLKLLRERLAANGVVSIGVADSARRTIDVPFCRGSLRVATGPAHLAHTTRASLLPTYVVRDEDGAYVVSIAEPLDVDDSSEPDYAVALRTYATMLQPWVENYSDQWNGWLELGRLVETDTGFLRTLAPQAEAWTELLSQPTA